MKAVIFCLTIPFLLYYLDFSRSFKDIYDNFGIYMPFFNVTTYIDLAKYVLIPLITGNGSPYSQETLYTFDELRQFKGEKDDIIYISILGRVFDVSTGATFYGPGKAYHCFAGQDASRAFVTGDFSNTGLSDDVLDMSSNELMQLKDWLKMYENKYQYKGKLIGRFYNDNGAATQYTDMLEQRFLEAEEQKNNDEEEKKRFPPCNVEWIPESGSRVWCSVRSGGIERSWVGVPRKVFESGHSSYRCACINTSPQSVSVDDSDNIPKSFMEYEGCDPNSSSCFIKS